MGPLLSVVILCGSCFFVARGFPRPVVTIVLASMFFVARESSRRRSSSVVVYRDSWFFVAYRHSLLVVARVVVPYGSWFLVFWFFLAHSLSGRSSSWLAVPLRLDFLVANGV